MHGNQIMQVSGLEDSVSLKVLNLAGNNIKNIGYNDFFGLSSLKELNLRRNKIKKLHGFENTPQLQKLYLSNNDIKKIEDIGSIAKALQIREISIDGNPITLTAECVSFLVSYLPNLQVLSSMQINEQIRRTAMAWRTLKEQSNSAFLDLSTEVCINVRREEVISNAKINWELLRSQRKCFNSNTSKMNTIKSDLLQGFTFQSSSAALDPSRVKTLSRSKSKDFGSLTSINENNDGKKSFKRRSCSSDNLLKINNGTSKSDVNQLEFKLPPILVPIIDNLTNNQTISNKTTIVPMKPSPSSVQDCTDSSESEAESSESHQSLKSGLRNHLLKSTRSQNSVDYDINCVTYTMIKNSRIFPNSGLLELDLQSDNNNHDSQSTRLTNLSKLSSMSKGSSFDSAKSFYGDSSSSSLSGSDKNRITSAKMKKFAHYRSNRAATARAKHKAAIPVSTPPPHPTPLKEKEQGNIFIILKHSGQKIWFFRPQNTTYFKG